MSVVQDMRTKINISNQEFLEGLFGSEWNKVHVTSFVDDPGDIEQSRRGLCWGGSSAGRLIDKMVEAENQYFCISLFDKKNGKPVRQKALFDACFVIVADDVVEKLPVERVERLPPPSYKIFTSAGSEQWGWILGEACEDRAIIENLLEGLVVQGLAPGGVDPGMKGVTRYVRLPEGSNTKEKRRDQMGNPFKCYLSEWNPERMYSVVELANTFGIDLYRSREEVLGCGVAVDSDLVRNHPLIKGGHLRITGEGSDSWIRCDCPNGSNHSGGDLSGAAVQIQEDGGVFFQCHHGHCNGEKGKKLTGVKVINLLSEQTGIDLKAQIKEYQQDIIIEGTKKLMQVVKVEKDEKGGTGTAPLQTGDAMEPSKGVEDEYNYSPNEWIYLPSLNKFYHLTSGSEVPVQGFDALHLAAFKGKKMKPSSAYFNAMEPGRHTADAYAWVPVRWGEEIKTIIYHDGKRCINQFRGYNVTPRGGSVDLWLDLMESIFESDDVLDQVIMWMAHIFQRPEVKLQWHIILMGNKGTGKDSLLKPLMQILGASGGDISAENLEGGWGDYFARKMLVALQEVYREQDKKFANMMKNFAASTSTGIKQWNLKGGRIVSQPDTLAMFAFSNHRHCVALEPGERRYLVVDSFNVEPLDAQFYIDYHNWLDRENGAAAIFDYLLNVDLSGFNQGKVPFYTDAYHELVEGGKYDYEHVIEEMYQNKESIFSVDHFQLKTLMDELKKQGHKMGQKGVIRCIENLGFRKFRGQKKVGGINKKTPTFFTNKLNENDSDKEIYDFYFR